MKIFKSILLSFTIWIMTALFNTILGGGWLSFSLNEWGTWPGTFFMIFSCTLVFSLPGMFIFWIVLLMNWEQELLFRLLLKTAFVISCSSSVILYLLPAAAVNGQPFSLSLCVVIASIASLMMHHSTIKTISTNNRIKNHG